MGALAKFLFLFFSFKLAQKLIRRTAIAHNGLGLCVVALSRNLKLTTTLDRAITQSPCYVPLISNQNVR